MIIAEWKQQLRSCLKVFDILLDVRVSETATSKKGTNIQVLSAGVNGVACGVSCGQKLIMKGF